METAGALKWSFRGEREANASRYKWTILQEHEITHLAENKHQSPKLLDTNRQRWVFAVATVFDFAAATFRWAPLTLRPPFALSPEQTFMQKFRNCLKTDKKGFSGRTESRCSEFHSHLRLNWRVPVGSVNWLKTLCEANYENFGGG